MQIDHLARRLRTASRTPTKQTSNSIKFKQHRKQNYAASKPTKHTEKSLHCLQQFYMISRSVFFLHFPIPRLEPRAQMTREARLGESFKKRDLKKELRGRKISAGCFIFGTASTASSVKLSAA
jgi:hypothetical protein